MAHLAPPQYMFQGSHGSKSSETMVLPDNQTPERSRTAGKDEESMERLCGTSREVASSCERTAAMDYVEAINNAMMFWPDNSDIIGMEPSRTSSPICPSRSSLPFTLSPEPPNLTRCHAP